MNLQNKLVGLLFIVLSMFLTFIGPLLDSLKLTLIFGVFFIILTVSISAIISKDDIQNDGK